MNTYAHDIVQIIVYRWAPHLEYLVLKRSERDGGWWQPVTGHVEPGEPEREAALREIQEEIGVEKLKYLSDPIAINEITGGGQAFVYMAEVSTKQQVVLSNEHSQYRWADLQTALSLLKYDGNKQNIQLADALLAEAR